MSEPERSLARGLPMVRPPDPTVLEEERRWLAEVEGRGFLRRSLALLGRGGPGYLQSAMTLGGGSASAALLAGAAFGYELLWVGPLGMLIGTIMLAAVAQQTLSTGMRPFEAMRTHAGGVFAWGWAIGALLASVVWHFAQYSLASAVVVDMGSAAGAEIPRGVAGGLILVWAVVTAQLFGSRSKWTARFDRLLKVMIWLIVLSFGLVAVKAGIDEPGAIVRGFLSFSIPDDRGDVSAAALIISGLATAVGVNMVFLYPYTLLARGWGREHRRLARFDLVFGMLVPYVFATSLIVIAAASTIHTDFSGTRMGPIEAAGTLAGTIGPVWGRIIFHTGILAMVLTTITMHMICAGLACSEMFGWEFGGWKYRLAVLVPTPGILGCFFWSEMSVWLAVPTSVVAGFLLPLAYLGFLKLQNSRPYLGDDLPAGGRRIAWLGGMALGTAVMIAFLGWYLVTRGPGFLEQVGL